MKTNDRLKSYQEKRDFERTPEPAGTEEESQGGGLFVVQQHDARNLHYDLRLEVNGVLKSWAVPKGPSTDPSVKRLAVATEDHPLAYASFEGVIPEGEYGAGKVIVWDTGTYRNLTEKSGRAVSAEDAIRHGHIHVWLEGRKLRGGFALNRFRTGKQEQWLLMKVRDEGVGPDDRPVESRPESVLTGRTLEDIAADGVEENSTSVRKAVTLAQALCGARPRESDAMPMHVKPMLASLTEMPPDFGEYAFEYKWDGIRAVLYWDGKRTRIESRNNLDITYRWPELADIGPTLGPASAILDGEIVALDAKNRVSFGLLSRRMHLSDKPTAERMRAVPIVYMIFDLLYLEHRSLMHLSYKDRRAVLRELNLSADAWQTPKAVAEDPHVILEAAVENGMEGLVAKKLTSPYRPGDRSRDWFKIKAVNKQEFVIGGWIPVKGAVKAGVGALLVGYYDDEQRLQFAGKVGTGFSDADRMDLKTLLGEVARDTSPFATRVPDANVRFVEPEIVAEVAFRELTPDGKLRHPSFKGLRQDKEPREVALEKAG